MSKYRKMTISVSGMCYAKLKLSNRADAVRESDISIEQSVKGDI